MKKLLIFILIGLIICSFALELPSGIADTIIKINENNETAEIDWILVSYGNFTTEQLDDGDFKIEIEYNNSVVYETNFDLGTDIIFWDSEESGGAEEIPRDYAEFYLPFYDSSQMIKVYHKSYLIFETSLEKYLCDKNNVCDEDEDYLTCPSDCPSGEEDGLCDRQKDGKCDPDCLEEFALDIDCTCGNEICEAEYGENKMTCCEDCGCPTGTECYDKEGCRPPSPDEIPIDEEYGKVTINEKEEGKQDTKNQGGLDWMLFIILGVVLLILIIAVIFHFKKGKTKKEEIL